MDKTKMFEMVGPDRSPPDTDPKLRKAMSEINEIFKKHDIGGHVILVSPSHAEFRFFFEPSWSAIRRDDQGVRIKAKKADLGSQEAVNKALEGTAHLLLQIGDHCIRDAKICVGIATELGKHVEIEHKSFSGFVPTED